MQKLALPQELLAAPTKMDIDGSGPAQVHCCPAPSASLCRRCCRARLSGPYRTFCAASARGSAGEVNESLLIARGGHGQFHERVDVECEVAGGRYTTSKRELAAQYADIYFFRLHKVRSPRAASHKDEEPRMRSRGARGSSSVMTACLGLPADRRRVPAAPGRGARVQLKKPLKEAAVRKFGGSVPHVDRILEAESGVQCVVIGTLYKNMKVAGPPRVPRTLPAVTRCAPACVLGATAPFPSVLPSHTATLSLLIYPSAEG